MKPFFSLSPIFTKAASIPGRTFSTALGHYKFIDSVVGEHGGDAQVLGDDDLLGHRRDTGSRSPAGGRSGIIRDLTRSCEGGE
jgi:hypothetical protein